MILIVFFLFSNCKLHGLDEVLAVRGLVDRKRLGETDLFGVLAQDARKDRVEGHCQLFLFHFPLIKAAA